MTMAPIEDEFYIGYDGGMPPRARRRVRAVLVVAAIASITALGTILMSVSKLPASRFDFGIVSDIRGTLRRAPYPVLERDGRAVWLVGPGKHGAEEVLADVPDGPVIVRGQRIERDGIQMFEVLEAKTASTAEGPPGRQAVSPAGRVTLRGEIVDSKCFLGVMNPGEGAVHRDCARRCLSGGIPPMLLVRNALGREQLVALVSRTGGRIPALAPLAGIAVEVNGRLVRERTTYVLFVEDWRR